VPLPYQPQNNDIPVKTPPTGFDALRTIAVSRIYLDNFDHITAYWVGMGMKLAQVALSQGGVPAAGDLRTRPRWSYVSVLLGLVSMAWLNPAKLPTKSPLSKLFRPRRTQSTSSASKGAASGRTPASISRRPFLMRATGVISWTFVGVIIRPPTREGRDFPLPARRNAAFNLCGRVEGRGELQASGCHQRRTMPTAVSKNQNVPCVEPMGGVSLAAKML
jgi:hypothetical protein